MENTIQYNEPIHVTSRIGNLDEKARALIEIIRKNPYQNPPAREKLIGDLRGLHSRRINVQHRLVYEVPEQDRTVKNVSLWVYCER